MSIWCLLSTFVCDTLFPSSSQMAYCTWPISLSISGIAQSRASCSFRFALELGLAHIRCLCASAAKHTYTHTHTQQAVPQALAIAMLFLLLNVLGPWQYGVELQILTALAF